MKATLIVIKVPINRGYFVKTMKQ